MAAQSSTAGEIVKWSAILVGGYFVLEYVLPIATAAVVYAGTAAAGANVTGAGQLGRVQQDDGDGLLGLW